MRLYKPFRTSFLPAVLILTAVSFVTPLVGKAGHAQAQPVASVQTVPAQCVQH